MRILVAHDVSAQRTGGMSRIMGFIHDRIVTSGHTVDEFTSDDKPRYACGRFARLGFPWAVYRHSLEAARDGRRYDLINVHEPSAAFVIAARGQLGKPQVVVTSHGVEDRAWQLYREEGRRGRGGPPLKTRLAHPALTLSQCRYSLRRADHVLCLNDDDRHFIVERYRRRPADVTRIYPAADLEFSGVAVARRYDAAVRSVLFAGTWRKNKGIQDLVPAFVSIARDHPDVTLTILGGGMPAETVRSDFPPAIRPRVAVVQTADEAETVAAFRSAGILIMPSLFEGTPLVIMEAMMAGLPIVTTTTCGMKDVIADGRTGLLVPTHSPAEVAAAVSRLLGDPLLRERLGRAAASEARSRYTWDAVAAPVLAIYESLVPSTRPATGPIPGPREGK